MLTSRASTPAASYQSGLEFAGFTFATASGEPLRTVDFGNPPGVRKLRIPDLATPDRLLVTLPGLAEAVSAVVSAPDGLRTELRALDAEGHVLANDAATAGDLRELRVEAEGVARAELTSELRGTLVQICGEY